ncbi:aldose 1-epimerase family protein [Mucilaginibacter aquatilis]|uniref:Aldose 1-epimerase family protein n=1 Tax=Mucilaginibacter aquatilis TaxID=1517760 RepID=A0A6I4I8I7_9SPHI|nr:aldose 1-epimerase family protein [Mucilaginibacter aquatilis]MVN90308.1 aldose 1-epimerase family protein [Mucilaginibacter aquatilis]
MVTIENEFLKASISSKGGQLTSLINKASQTELIWQANEQIWPWHAPNLFPIVGGLVNNELRVNGTTYNLSRHGFARQSDFSIAEANPHHADLALHCNEQTLAVYPYKFAFHILYDLIDNALRITYKVINLDDKAIYFSVGAHPAFNVPFNNGDNYEDYFIEFEVAEELNSHVLSAEGYFTGETTPIKLEGKKLALTRNLFDNDALVFKNIQSKVVTIKSAKFDQSITVEYPHYNHLGIWAKPGANFVCIEPWLGYADDVVPASDISEKPAIQKLEKGHVFESPYYISI